VVRHLKVEPAARMRSAAILLDSTAYVSVRDLCAALGAEHVYRAGDTATVSPTL
jgi:hypothetical protein